MVIEVDKVKDNLFVLKGGGGNTAVFVTATGVVVVDTKNPGWGQPILDKIKTLTDKPVTTIINTHTHGDRVSGNVAFPATVEVVTQENTKTYMNQVNPVYGLQTGPQTSVLKESGKGLPNRTFKDKLTMAAARPDRSALLRSGPYGRRRVRDLQAASRDAHRRYVPTRASRSSTRTTAARASGTPGRSPRRRAKDVDTIINGHNATTTTPANLRSIRSSSPTS